MSSWLPFPFGATIFGSGSQIDKLVGVCMASTSSSTQFKCACNDQSFQQNKIFVCSGQTYGLDVVVQGFRRATNMRANCAVHMACRTPSNAGRCNGISGGENCTTLCMLFKAGPGGCLCLLSYIIARGTASKLATLPEAGKRGRQAQPAEWKGYDPVAHGYAVVRFRFVIGCIWKLFRFHSE